MVDPRDQPRKEAYRHEPWDIDCEQELLGACLKNNTLIDQAAELIDGSHFYDPLHGRLFDTMAYLQTEGEVTPLFLHATLKSDPGVMETGGQAYFDALLAAAPSLPNIRNLTAIVLDLAQRRALIKAGEALVKGAYEPPQDASTDKLVDTFQVEVDQIANAAPTMRRRPVRASAAMASMLTDIRQQALQEQPHGVLTGLEPLDEVIGPLLPGKMIVAGGRPGMGKSTLATNICRAVAEKGVPADYLSGEMDNDELSARIGTEIDFDFAWRERLDPMRYGSFVQKDVTAAWLRRMEAANDHLEALDFHLFDTPAMTIEWIEALCRRRCRTQPGHRVVVIDHLQLVEWQAAPRGATPVQVVTQITKRLKAMAKSLGITVILLSQLSRDVDKRDDKHPMMSDFRESGSIEQDADIVIGLVRPLRYASQDIKHAKNEEQRHKAILAYDDAKGVLEAEVLKNRSGREALVKLFIDEKASTVRSRAPDAQPGEGELDYGELEKEMRA